MQTENEVACHGALRRRVLYYGNRPIQDMSRNELLAVVEELFEDHERMQQNMAQERRMQKEFARAIRRRSTLAVVDVE